MSTAYIQTHTTESESGDFDVFSLATCEKYTVVASGDGSVTLFDHDTGAKSELWHDKSGARHVVADENYIAAVFFTGEAKVWHTSTLEEVDIALPAGIYSVALSSQKKALAVATINAALSVFDLAHDNAEILNVKGGQNQVATCVDITVDGNYVAVGLNSGKASIYSTESGNLAYTLPLHTMSPRSIKFSPMSSLVAVCGNVDSISIYSLNGGDLIGTLTGHSSWVFALSWSETGEFLLSVSHDSTARIWSLESRSCVCTLNDSTGPLFAGAYFNKGWAPKLIGGQHKGIVAAGSDGTIRWYREAAGA